MKADELRKKFLEFFKEKGHKIVPSASLIPENDPSVLFTTAGMHPLVPYLMGEKHPMGKRITNCQKCIRTIDIDEVGDATHHTFFEMLGNWSFGDPDAPNGVGAGYFKKEAIEMSWEFLTDKKWLGLDKNKIAVSIFAGDDDAPFDQEAFDVWKNIFEKNNLPIERIAKLPKKNNWWGMEKGPCGPDSEMFYWAGDENKVPESFNDDNNLWIEIWNDVFMQYNKTSSGKLETLKQKNVDTGMGMERTLAALNGLDDNYKTELFWPIIEKIEEISGKKYENNKKEFRIIADHIKASMFIISDGIVPSNVQRGYVLRRLIRRAIRHGKILGIESNFTRQVGKVIQKIYKNTYPEILEESVLNILEEEENKFRKTLESGLKYFEVVVFARRPKEDGFFWTYAEAEEDQRKNIMANIYENAFNLFQTYGFPFEMIVEEARRRSIPIDENKLKIKFEEQLKQHQDLSRTASAGMFKGGLADAGEETTKLHTVAHLMLAGLRKVLGDHVVQKGSNITAERLRFDFSHPDKITDEQKKAVEDFVNDAIQKNIPVICKEMNLEEAKKIGAMGVFENKYGEKVKVYTIGETSKEICGGPHVKNTGEIKGVFKIKKEESSSAEVRRIKAVVE